MKRREFLKQVKALLNSGEIVRVFKGTCKHGITLWIENPSYIHYQSYGQSAVKNNLKELAWVIYDLYGKSDIVNDYSKGNDYTFKVVAGIYS
jgi:hypothetical protein